MLRAFTQQASQYLEDTQNTNIKPFVYHASGDLVLCQM